MESIRILLAGMPRLMSDIVEVGLGEQPDMEIVAVLDSLLLAAAAEAERPDIVVIGVEGVDLPPECGPLLAALPQTRILGIRRDGAEAALYELRPQRVSLGAVSPAELPALLRSVAAEPAWLSEVR